MKSSCRYCYRRRLSFVMFDLLLKFKRVKLYPIWAFPKKKESKVTGMDSKWQPSALKNLGLISLCSLFLVINPNELKLALSSVHSWRQEKEDHAGQNTQSSERHCGERRRRRVSWAHCSSGPASVSCCCQSTHSVVCCGLFVVAALSAKADIF